LTILHTFALSLLMRPKNTQPHFDENIIVWSDKYSGVYSPPPTEYSEQFELQWKLALDGAEGYYNNPGASVEDDYIADCVYQWTGKPPPKGTFEDKSMGSRVLDFPLDPQLIHGKKCIDVACGMGRWTRTMQALGASSVLSTDISESALKSVSRFNKNVVKANIMEIPQEHPDWIEKFDFTNFWGVAMCTHDPQKAFLSAASTVKPGGSMYLMVYCPEGQHNTKLVNIQRRHFHSLKSVEERIAYVDHVYNLEWDVEYSLYDNLRNSLIRIGSLFFKHWKGSKVGFLDLLEPYYNWVIPMDVIDSWTKKAGFKSYKVLYKKPKSAYHILAHK